MMKGLLKKLASSQQKPNHWLYYEFLITEFVSLEYPSELNHLNRFTVSSKIGPTRRVSPRVALTQMGAGFQYLQPESEQLEISSQTFAQSFKTYRFVATDEVCGLLG
jgi:hypothetical protein